MEKERALLAAVGVAAVVLAPVEGLILRALRFGDLRSSMKDGANVALVTAGVWYLFLRLLVMDMSIVAQFFERRGLPPGLSLFAIALVSLVVTMGVLSLLARKGLLHNLVAALLILIVTAVPRFFIAAAFLG